MVFGAIKNTDIDSVTRQLRGDHHADRATTDDGDIKYLLHQASRFYRPLGCFPTAGIDFSMPTAVIYSFFSRFL